MTEPLHLLNDIEALLTEQRLNRAKVEAGSHGCGVAMVALRVAANDIRLKAEHFRALTSPSLDTDEIAKADAEHQRRWLNRRGGH
jgi:hypothetical protein